MSLQKPYSTSKNNAFSDVSTVAKSTQSWYWQLIQLLLRKSTINAFDAVWTDGGSHALPTVTCAGSSDGTTGAMDAVDRSPATFVAASMPMANEGSAHAWFVFKFPNGIGSLAGGKGPVYLLYALDLAGGASNYQVSIWISFAGFTGGSNTNRPTATDENPVKHSSSAVSVLQNNATTGIARNMHLTFAPDGTFFVVTSQVGGGHVEYSGALVETISALGRTNNRPIVYVSDLNPTDAHPPFVIGEGGWQSGNNQGSCNIVGFTSAGAKVGFSSTNPATNGGAILTSASFLGRADLEDGEYDSLPMPLMGLTASAAAATCVFPVDWTLTPWVSGTNTPPQNTASPSGGGQKTRVNVGNTLIPASSALSM